MLTIWWSSVPSSLEPYLHLELILQYVASSYISACNFIGI